MGSRGKKKSYFKRTKSLKTAKNSKGKGLFFWGLSFGYLAKNRKNVMMMSQRNRLTDATLNTLMLRAQLKDLMNFQIQTSDIWSSRLSIAV